MAPSDLYRKCETCGKYGCVPGSRHPKCPSSELDRIFDGLAAQIAAYDQAHTPQEWIA